MAGGGRESYTWNLRKSAILFEFEVSWAPDRAPPGLSRYAVPLRFSVIFEYGGLIP